LVDFFGSIGCNNAALSRELKANAHLFGYLFAERHVPLRLFEAEGKAVAYPICENEVDNIWVQPLDGSRGRQITNFDSEQILNFRWSPDGKNLCILRGHTDSDVVCSRNPTDKLNAYDLPWCSTKTPSSNFQPM